MALECDYLVIGGGAMGMAFTDTLINETQGHTVIIVDKHSQPGGHWNDAYPFVRLHQPSHYYGVNSQRLESQPPPTDPNESAELASAAEVLTYFRRVLEKLEATGRVRYMPMCMAEEQPRLRVVSVLHSEQAWDVTVRKKVVDATYMNVEVPSMRPPPFPVATGALIVPPNGLPSIKTPHSKYVVIGSGKTGMDAVLWLLRHNVPAERLIWVMPRDAWLLNRASFQPGRLLRYRQVATAAAMQGGTTQGFHEAMERAGMFLRLDQQRQPTSARCATVSSEELADMRRVENVVRSGHVKEVGLDRLLLEHGEVATGAGTLHVDCTADGLARRPAMPIFTEGHITLQAVSVCQQVFSSALLAHVEAKWPEDDAKKNEMCAAVPHPDTPDEFMSSAAIAGANAEAWLSNGLFWWLARSRLWNVSHDLKLSNPGAWFAMAMSGLPFMKPNKPPAPAPAAKL